MNTPKESTIGKNTSLEKALSILDCLSTIQLKL